MPCPTLKDLPAPPEVKSGWPWNEASKPASSVVGSKKIWPAISIVTPSFNQDLFIEETIRSVLLQGYPNLEYIVIDGGSPDGTLNIIKKYEKWLSYWVSEPDSGQSEAINKGWTAAGGEILAWLNSDDTYTADALFAVAEIFAKNPQVDMLYGDCRMIDETGRLIKMAPATKFDLKKLVCNQWIIPQQSTFIRRSVFDRIGKLDENLHLIMDWEYWLRIALANFRVDYFSILLSNFRRYENAKTSLLTEHSGEEKIEVLNRIFSKQRYLSQIGQYKKPAYCYVHNWTGQAYLSNNHRLRALMHFLKSARYGPYQLKSSQFRKTLRQCFSIH